MTAHTRRCLIAGNWKMNGRLSEAAALSTSIIEGIDSREDLQALDWLICPPFVHLQMVAAVLSGRQARSPDLAIKLGAQDLSASEDGAFTGEVSAEMLRDCACTAVLVGHSERRQHFAESEALIARKLKRAVGADLQIILCVGESEQARLEGRTEAVIADQLARLPALKQVIIDDMQKHREAAKSQAGQPEPLPHEAFSMDRLASQLVIAYEPVWAIGTGKSAKPEEVQQVHAFIRDRLAMAGWPSASMRILYGGSVNAVNAQALFTMPDVDGVLVGGAALKATNFLAIGEAAVRRIIAPLPKGNEAWLG